eukprot:CAMPEP_0179015646 /NCGR_PEP_ID=MMETSP0796-20121207/2905_1 /TAXON_ID=73915 /ORGANISM="Pyrodinium bahamense, Strain pbaha01" /LENGTH=37 /DNA_ID= /DNA_START= /DNA_END= /DNA_ORIENTATION=
MRTLPAELFGECSVGTHGLLTVAARGGEALRLGPRPG